MLKSISLAFLAAVSSFGWVASRPTQVQTASVSPAMPEPPQVEQPRLAQIPASVPCPACGGSMPTTLYLNGAYFGHTFNGLPVQYHHTNPNDPTQLTFNGYEPNVAIGSHTTTALVTFTTGNGSARSFDLGIVFQPTDTPGGVGIGASGCSACDADCTSFTFRTLNPGWPANSIMSLLPPGMTLNP